MEKLFEANFNPKDALKVAKAYGSLFGKEFGGTFRPLCVEWFKKAKETGSGVRMLNSSGAMMRLNFSNRMSNFADAPKDFVTLSSIDYWAPGNTNFTCPTTSCYFEESINVVKIWKTLSNLIRAGKSGKYTINDLLGIKESVEELDEAPFNVGNLKQRHEFTRAKGWPTKSRVSKEAFEQYVKMNNAEEDWNKFLVEIENGRPEENETEQTLKQTEKEFENHPTCDPKRIFNVIERLTYAVCKGITKSFICCGMGGVGKTYHVTKVMEEEVKKNGIKYDYHAGMKVSPQSFYVECFRGREAVNVFDEADDILSNDDIVVMLKPILDTTGKNTMEYLNGFMPTREMSDNEIKEYSAQCDAQFKAGGVTWFSRVPPKNDEQVWCPNKFFFEGSMIFITNKPASKIDQAIISRSAFVDVWLTERQVYNRIFDILKAQLKKGVFSENALKSYAQSLGVDFNDIIEGKEIVVNAQKRNKQLTVRSAVLALKMIDAGGFPDWEELSAYM